MEKIIGVVQRVVFYNETNGYGIIKLKLDYKNPALAKYRTTLFSNVLSILCTFDRKPYEDEEYVRCGKGLPNVGQTVKTEFGKGKVISVDILNRKYKADIDGVIREIELGCEECERSK